MKNPKALSPLLASLLLGSMALAQAGNLPDAPQPQDSASTDVQLAQAPSTQAPATPASTTPATNPDAQQSAENKLVTQAAPFPRYRGPMAPPRGYGYPSAFAPRPPALSPVGALIGFGAGAALAAAGTQDHTAGARVAAGLLGGGLCALIGGAIGNAFSIVHTHNYRDWRDWDDAQERKHHKVVPRPIEPDVDASSTPAPAASAGSL